MAAAINHFMPAILSDDDVDTWSSASSSDSGHGSYQQFGSSAPVRGADEYSLYEDYFGLFNLINQIKISEDNPLLQATQKKLAFVQRGRRVSWESDGSDPAVVHSPSLESSVSAPSSYEEGLGRSFINGMKSDSIDIGPNLNSNDVHNHNCVGNSGTKLPPPSMRLSKSLREHIISGAYQQERELEMANRCQNTDQCSPVMSRNNRRPLLPTQESSPPRTQGQGGLRICVFCRNNGEGESVYTSHILKDAEGRTTCPILRAYTCPICKANGDNSHTIKYCPLNQKGPQSLGGVIPGPPDMGNPSRNTRNNNNGSYQRPSFPQQRHPFNMAPQPPMPNVNMPKLRQ